MEEIEEEKKIKIPKGLDEEVERDIVARQYVIKDGLLQEEYGTDEDT